MPSKKPTKNLFKVARSNFKPMLENDFLSNFRNKYATNKVKIGPIVLDRKFLDRSGNNDIMNNESLRSPVVIAQKRIALLIITNVEL